MRKLLTGQRRMSVVQAGVALTALLACISLVVFGYEARATAKGSQQIARNAIRAERAVLEVIVSACENRVVYDSESLSLARLVHNFGLALDEVARQTALPAGLSAEQLHNYRAQVRAIHALDVGSTALANRYALNSCARYRKLLADLPAV